MKNRNQTHLKLKLTRCSQSTPLCIGTVEQWGFCDCFFKVNLIPRKGPGLIALACRSVLFSNVPHMNCSENEETHKLLNILSSQGTEGREGHSESHRMDFPFVSFSFIVSFFSWEQVLYKKVIRFPCLSCPQLFGLWEFLCFPAPT